MAYAAEKDSGFRLTSFQHSSTAILGLIRAAFDRIVNRESLMVDGRNYPVSRPVDEKDGRLVLAFSALDQAISESTAAANVTLAFTEADGDAGSLVFGKTLGSSVVAIMGRRMGGFNAEQTFELEGAMTETWTL